MTEPLPTYNALRTQRHKLACPECGSTNTVARQVGATPDYESHTTRHWARMECTYCGFRWETGYRPPRSR